MTLNSQPEKSVELHVLYLLAHSHKHKTGFRVPAKHNSGKFPNEFQQLVQKSVLPTSLWMRTVFIAFIFFNYLNSIPTCSQKAL